jgi:hypothetical protein
MRNVVEEDDDEHCDDERTMYVVMTKMTTLRDDVIEDV